MVFPRKRPPHYPPLGDLAGFQHKSSCFLFLDNLFSFTSPFLTIFIPLHVDIFDFCFRHLLHLFFCFRYPSLPASWRQRGLSTQKYFPFLKISSFAWTSLTQYTLLFMSILYSNKQTHVFQHFWGNIGWNNANNKRLFQNDIVKYMLFEFAEISNKVSFLNFSLVIVVNVHRIKKNSRLDLFLDFIFASQ